MYGRLFNAAVVVFWLATMSWLVTRKLLPPFLVGDPPDYKAIAAARHGEKLVGWEVWLNDQRVGRALSNIQCPRDGDTQLKSWVHFNQIAWSQTVPSWLLRALKRLDSPALDGVSLDARSTVYLDNDGQLKGFESSVRLEPLLGTIEMLGTVVGGRMHVTLQSGKINYETAIDIPAGFSIDDGLSPPTRLPGLRPGQRWTIPTFSPLRPPSSPVQILNATVTATDPIHWNGKPQPCLLVTYRPETGLSWTGGTPQGRVWVRRDGLVLRQAVSLLDCTLTFERMLPDRAASFQAAVDNRLVSEALRDAP